MTIPHHPFCLRIHWRDGKVQVRAFDSAAAMLTAADSLKPSLVASYEATIVIATRVLAVEKRNGRPQFPINPTETVR